MDNHYDEAYQYAVLIAKHLRGELSAIDQIKLNTWLNEKPENALLLEKLQNEGTIKNDLDFLASLKTDDAWQNIIMRTQKVSLTRKVYIIIQKWKFAAVFFILLSAIGVFYKLSHPALKVGPVITKSIPYKNDVPPGTDKAKLTLTDGSVIIMDGHTAGTVKSYAGLKITSAHGAVSYQVTDSNSVIKNQYNTITIPAGCKYKVTLPDGSMVWLNSESSLKFPVVFNKSERNVYLTGEAYFEVAKNKLKPFKVFSNNTVVQVLGTHFNIHAYSDDEAVKTTLIEGSVKIYWGAESKMIVPGQQAYIKLNSSKIKIHEINVDESIAWKNDLFLFDSEDIKSVMKEVARWYNVEVEYKDDISQAHFSGSISRNNNISQVLNMLELTGGVHFAIDGRKIIVTR
jgi:ferric-dicitrate binding protein FerR (iron transport regulator)